MILHEPSYVAYVPAIVFAGGVVAPRRRRRAADDFALDPAAVEAAITPRTKALFLGYPANPTGAVLDDDVQDELAADRRAPRPARVQRRDLRPPGLRHVPPPAFASLPGMRERTILMGGFSKAYAMTGWRVGWMCAPAAILEGIVKVHQYGIMSAPTVAQDAALAALQAGEPAVQAMVAEYDRRRRLLVDGLNALGLATFEPRGAFYAFPDISLDRPDLRRVHRAPAARGAGRGRARATPSGPRATGTFACATRPPTSSSRRRSPGSAASWSGSGPPDRQTGGCARSYNRRVIISDEHRYVFVEQPHTACTAIRDELTAFYGGRPILDRHATYAAFLRAATPDQKRYFVFSGLRNPLDERVSLYCKYRTDHHHKYSRRFKRLAERRQHAFVESPPSTRTSPPSCGLPSPPYDNDMLIHHADG